MTATGSRFGVVAIGRNEGERLRKCLNSVRGVASVVVYVDSGSTDDSVAMARGLATSIVELDMRQPFTAGRARNDGLKRLRELAPDLKYIQFVDGDCEVVRDWFDAALGFLDVHGDVAVVCGRRRERHPERSIYNLLCDIEWNTPVGETKTCGGDALMRVTALMEAGAYRPDLIAGEEPELCVRLRAAGWRIWRLDKEMTLHDAAMLRFVQWWRRTMRGGYAYAQAVALHGSPPERHGVSESRSIRLWGLVMPLFCAAWTAFAWPYGLLTLMLYPAQIARLALRGRGPNRWRRAFFLVIGKFPEMVGQMKFVIHRYLGTRARLIEYK